MLVECPCCHSPIPNARLVEVEGRVWLDVGGFLVSAGMRHCHACGEIFHWKQPRYPMSELVARWEQRQVVEAP